MANVGIFICPTLFFLQIPSIFKKSLYNYLFKEFTAY